MLTPSQLTLATHQVDSRSIISYFVHDGPHVLLVVVIVGTVVGL
jgi:hypothetical protein